MIAARVQAARPAQRPPDTPARHWRAGTRRRDSDGGLAARGARVRESVAGGSPGDVAALENSSCYIFSGRHARRSPSFQYDQFRMRKPPAAYGRRRDNMNTACSD
jgi:hypothetical protein